MKVHVNIDPDISEDKIELTIREMNPLIHTILSMINENVEIEMIPLQLNERVYLVKPEEVSHVFSENNKCFAYKNNHRYRFKGTLKQFEEQYNRHSFLRISKYCLVNLNWIEYFEATFGGSLAVVLKSGQKEIVSRKYTKDLKQAILGSDKK